MSHIFQIADLKESNWVEAIPLVLISSTGTVVFQYHYRFFISVALYCILTVGVEVQPPSWSTVCLRGG